MTKQSLDILGKQMRKLSTVLIVLGLILTGCGNKSDANDSSTNEDRSAVDRPSYVRPIGEITGTVTVYTPLQETQQEGLKEVWNKYYPDVKLEIQSDSIGTLVTRIRSDEKNDADVIIGGFFEGDGEEYHDILQPYTSIIDDEVNYHDSYGYYTYFDVQVMSLVVNPKLAKELGVDIKGYEDLLDEKLNGKIILSAPDASSSGWRQLQTMMAVTGDEFNDDKSWDYIEKLMSSSYSTTSSKDVYNLVINGEYVVGLTYEPVIAALIKDGADVENVYMVEGNTGLAGGAAITKNAPNIEGAKALIDLMASAEAQEMILKSAGRGTSINYKLNDLPSDEELGLVPLDIEFFSKNKKEIIDKWNALWAKTH